MLQSYCIQGFKSIKNATEVDLKKTQYQTLEKTNVCNGILKGCMFVGANASGKTNLIEPLRFLLMALFAVREMKWKNFLCLFSDGGCQAKNLAALFSYIEKNSPSKEKRHVSKYLK